MNPELKNVVQEMLHVHPELKNRGTESAPRSTANAPRRTAEEVEAEQRHEEERNPSVHDEQVQEEARSKIGRNRRSKSRSPAYSAVSSSEENPPKWAKFWIYSHQNAEERLFNLENEMRNKNEANSRPTDEVEAFKFEKKVYCKQYEFNQKVAEQLKAALNTHDPYSRERQLNEGIALINKQNKNLCWQIATAGIQL